METILCTDTNALQILMGGAKAASRAISGYAAGGHFNSQAGDRTDALRMTRATAGPAELQTGTSITALLAALKPQTERR